MLWGGESGMPEYRVTGWLFLRGLGFVYLIAFWSLWTQIIPLSGETGIMPIADRMEAMRAGTGELGVWERIWQVPTVFWLAAGDGFITCVCAMGCVLAGCAIVGFLTMPSLAGLWILYLSLVKVCVPWLGFQWDVLLLEAGLLGVLMSRMGVFDDPRQPRAPRVVPLLLVRWLLFRLMFASGMVKLLSGDAMWGDWTALTVHYETQPLPNPLAWHVHQLPLWFHKLSCGIMFGIELVLPFFFFLPRRLRLFAGIATVALMGVIIGTGNYTFFNLLVIVLCLSLMDDRFLFQLLPKHWRSRIGGKDSTAAGPAPKLRYQLRTMATAMFVGVTICFSAIYMLPMVKLKAPAFLHRWAGKVGQFHFLSSYGLFAVMTKERPEIVIEGSDDGLVWKTYEFLYKPGNLQRDLPFVAPHQPRLDWQMWFAALGNMQQNEWLAMLAIRLLEGELKVTKLLAVNPFPERAPRFVRAQLYRYNFTSAEERAVDGTLWKREFVGMYLRPISLANVRRR